MSFFHRPPLRHVVHALGRVCVVTLWWIAFYGGADWLVAHRAWRLSVHMSFEPGYPFIPQSVLVYNSLYPLCWLAPFVLRSRAQIDAMTLGMMRATAIAAVVFVLLPVKNAFPPTPDAGAWTTAVRLAKAAALTSNFLPSLHVALAAIAVAHYFPHGARWPRVALVLWLAAICVSTLVLHQHYLADVLTGLALGFACGPKRSSGEQAAGETRA